MALNKTLKDVGLFYEKLGNFNADSLYQNMRKASDYYYIGFLTQVSTDAPTSKILYSDFLQENGITFTYENTGKYRMYCNLFKPGYVEVEVNEGQNNAPASSVVLATVHDGYVEFTTLDGGSPLDDVLYKTPIKVKVWTNAGVMVPSIQTNCIYFGFVDFYSETYNNIFLDDAQTINAFTDVYGNGNLKNYMNGIGGDLYFSFNSPSDFIFTGCWLYYEGTSVVPSIPIYDSFGGQITTIDFQENSLLSYSCTNNKCFTKTFDSSFIELYKFGWMSAPFALSADYAQSNPFYVLDVSDVVSMNSLIISIYGINATYNWLDNLDGTATITLSNCYDWGSLPTLLLSDGVGNFLNITLDEIPC